MKPIKFSYIDNYENNDQETGTRASLPFVLGTKYGFHDENLNFIFTDNFITEQVLSRNHMGSNFFISRAENDLVEIKDYSGNTKARFISRGELNILRNRIYSYSLQDHLFEEYDSRGKLVWSNYFLAYPTSIDNNGESTIISFIDGTVTLVDKQGELKDYKYNGSRVNTVYGVGLGPENDRIALIGGLDEQRLEFLVSNDGKFYPEDIFVLPGEELRKPVFLRFSQYSPVFFYENSLGINMLNYQNKNMLSFKSANKVHSFQELNNGDMQFFLLGQNKHDTISDYELLVFYNSEGVIFNKKLVGTYFSLQINAQNKLFLGIDNGIAMYQIQEL